MKKDLSDFLKTFLFYVILCIATFLMLRMVIAYSNFDDHVGFLNEKQAYLSNQVWKSAFYFHVFSAVFCLFAGFTQFSNQLLKERRHVHRFMGRMYAYTIFLNFPIGLVMAYYANGFWPSKLAFFILDGLWCWFTLKAIIEAKKGNFTLHRNYMIRSYALTFSAITLRAWKLVLTNSIAIDPTTLYMIDAWLGFVPNLLIAEYIIRFRLKISDQTGSC